jgi:hypothetical protein
LGLYCLVPFGVFGRKKGKQISFESAHGNVKIHLDSAEMSMVKTLKKLPEVKKLTLNLVPADGNRKVRVTAQATIKKAPGAGAREMAAHLSEQISLLAKNVLGVDEVVSVDLDVKNIAVNPRKEVTTPFSTTPLLESPKKEDPFADTAPAEEQKPKSPASADASPKTYAGLATKESEPEPSVDSEPEVEDTSLDSLSREKGIEVSEREILLPGPEGCPDDVDPIDAPTGDLGDSERDLADDADEPGVKNKRFGLF